MNDKKNRLTISALDEISLVAAGDDPSAEVLIAKADPALMDMSAPGDDSADTFVVTNGRGAEDKMPTEIDRDTLDPELKTYIDELESLVDLLLEDDETPTDAETIDEPELELVGKDDEITKRDDIIAKLSDRLTEAEAVAKEERDHRVHQDMISKASSLPYIGETTDELASLLHELSDASPELAEKVEKILVAANNQIEKGGLFTEIGRAGTSLGVNSDVEGIAKELQTLNPALTREQSIVAAYESNPSLYNQTLREG